MEMGWTWVNEINLIPIKQPVGRPVGSTKPHKIKIKKYRYGVDLIFCYICKCYIQRRINAQHKRTKKHIFNRSLKY